MDVTNVDDEFKKETPKDTPVIPSTLRSKGGSVTYQHIMLIWSYECVSVMIWCVMRRGMGMDMGMGRVWVVHPNDVLMLTCAYRWDRSIFLAFLLPHLNP